MQKTASMKERIVQHWKKPKKLHRDMWMAQWKVMDSSMMEQLYMICRKRNICASLEIIQIGLRKSRYKTFQTPS